jgi:hypothetical protein
LSEERVMYSFYFSFGYKNDSVGDNEKGKGEKWSSLTYFVTTCNCFSSVSVFYILAIFVVS